MDRVGAVEAKVVSCLIRAEAGLPQTRGSAAKNLGELGELAWAVDE